MPGRLIASMAHTPMMDKDDILRLTSLASCAG